MKRTPITLVAAAFVLAAAVVAQQETPKTSASHLGTWQLISFKYGDAKDFSDFPKEQRRIKSITETHFTWVEYQVASGKAESMAGGAHTHQLHSQTETIEILRAGVANRIRKGYAPPAPLPSLC